MLTKLQARLVSFFSRPTVQTVIRHAVTAAVAAAIPLVAVSGVAGLATGVGAVVILRAVWAVLRPAIAQAEPDIAPILPAVPAPVQISEV